VLQDFLLRLHAKKTVCERIISSALNGNVSDFTAEDVCEKVKVLSNSIQSLIDNVELGSYSVWTLLNIYSSMILPEVLLHRSGCVGRPRIVRI